MYGGGFATIPAYLRDIFGTMQVGAIHGRLLTAWSVAGVLGPVLVNYIRHYQIDNGVPKAQAYSVTMYIMCVLSADRIPVQFRHAPGEREVSLPGVEASIMKAKAVLLWLAVGLPLLWGVYKTLQNAMKLFLITEDNNMNMNMNFSIGPLVALIAGVLILIMPQLLNYIVAIYLIVTGFFGLFRAPADTEPSYARRPTRSPLGLPRPVQASQPGGRRNRRCCPA